MSDVQARLDRIEALATRNGRCTGDVTTLDDYELAAIIAEGSGSSREEILALCDAAVQALVEGQHHAHQTPS